MLTALLYVAWVGCCLFADFAKANLVTVTLSHSTTPTALNIEPAHGYHAIARLGNGPSTTFDTHAQSAAQSPAPTTSLLAHSVRPAQIVNQSTLITEFDPYICGMFRVLEDTEHATETLFGKSKSD